MGLEPVRSSQFIADRFRSIHMVSIGKGISRGRLLAALRKIYPSTISNGSMSARMRHSEVSILAVSGSQGARFAAHPVPPGRAARRYIARGEGPWEGSIWLSTFPTHMALLCRRLYIEKKGLPSARQPLYQLFFENYESSLRPDSSILSMAASASAASAPFAKT